MTMIADLARLAPAGAAGDIDTVLELAAEAGCREELAESLWPVPRRAACGHRDGVAHVQFDSPAYRAGLALAAGSCAACRDANVRARQNAAGERAQRELAGGQRVFLRTRQDAHKLVAILRGMGIDVLVAGPSGNSKALYVLAKDEARVRAHLGQA